MALYTYESPEPGDLTFREGDVILVSKREGEWWNGSIGDRTGLFPGNYVKPKETDVRALDTYCTAHYCITVNHCLCWCWIALCFDVFLVFLSFAVFLCSASEGL